MLKSLTCIYNIDRLKLDFEMKRRMSSHKQLCLKDNCCGVKNNQQNFIALNNRHIQSTSRVKKSVNKAVSTKKLSAEARKNEEINKILQESYNEAKQENCRLLKKLNSKKKKVEEQQQKIKQLQTSVQNYSLQVQHFQSLLKAYEHKKHSDDITERTTKGQKYHTIIEAQQALTKETLEKYKILEKEYERYRNEMERKVEEDERKCKRLEKQNLQMKVKLENQRGKLQLQRSKLLVEKKYESQVQNIKKELSAYQNRSVKQSSSIHTSSLQTELTQLRQKNRLLQEQLLCLSSKLKQNQLSFQQREQQLLSSLDKINQKVIKFQRQTKSNTKKNNNESREWKQKYQQLMEKYLKKKEKFFSKNQQWAEIFKEFMVEIERLKKEIAYVSERNVKLVELYVQGETKDY